MLGNKDKDDIPVLQQACLNLVGDIEESMVSGYPFEVPKEYANLPQLKASNGDWAGSGGNSCTCDPGSMPMQG